VPTPSRTVGGICLLGRPPRVAQVRWWLFQSAAFAMRTSRPGAAARRFAALTGHADVSGLRWRQIDVSTGTLITEATSTARKMRLIFH
jgi:hypothetical protein